MAIAGIPWPAMRRMLLPQSLRRQFMLAVAGVGLLITAGGVTAVYALRVATDTTRLLAEERLVRMQEAQNLVQRTLLIESESYQLSGAESVDAMRDSYAEIVTQLELLDRLADRLATAEEDAVVLDLHQSSQSFRNTANIVAQLRENELRGGDERGRLHGKHPSLRPPPGGKETPERQFHDELRRHAGAMVATAQRQSDHYAQDYRNAMQELAQTSTRDQRLVTALLAGSLLLAWLVAQGFLGGHVLARLQLVSRALRQGDADGGSAVVPVRGSDEIAEMARAVEQFQEDRRKLVQRTAQVEAANKELEQFSYSMSHDMLAPLRALDGYSALLLQEHGASLDDEGKRLLQAIRDNAQRQGRLINDIVHFLSLSRRTLRYGPVDVARLASEVFAELQSSSPSPHVRIEIGALPPAWGDRDMIRQVLHNLLSNAIHFSPADGAALIQVGGASDDLEETYYVKDRGMGFDPRYADKLFRVFEHLHPPGQYEGSGTGLAIVKRIIERHRGRVWAEGRVGQGATFHFSLPRKSA
jgi:two-component system NtrC family sensor kinase